MPEYRVKWEIDVDGETPEDAAREALRIQRDPNSIATIFEVKERYTFGKISIIDFNQGT